MRWTLTTAGAIAMTLLGQRVVMAHWSPADWFLGGYFSCWFVSIYLKFVDKQ